MTDSLSHTVHAVEHTSESAGQTLGPQMQQQIAAGRKRRKAIDRTMAVAGFDAWTTAVLAALCVPFALFSWGSLVAAMVLATVAYVEFTGRSLLKQLDPRSLKVLAGNQVGLALIVILYAVWRLYLAATHQGYAATELQSMPQDALSALGPGATEMLDRLEVLVYILLIVGTILMQGGTALYYMTRRKALHEFVTQTPQWVIDVLKAAN